MSWFRRKRRGPAPVPPAVPPEPLVLGPIEEWPWGQKPGMWMIDPTGHLAGPIGDAEGYVAAHRSNIESEMRWTT